MSHTEISFLIVGETLGEALTELARLGPPMNLSGQVQLAVKIVGAQQAAAVPKTAPEPTPVAPSPAPAPMPSPASAPFAAPSNVTPIVPPKKKVGRPRTAQLQMPYPETAQPAVAQVTPAAGAGNSSPAQAVASPPSEPAAAAPAPQAPAAAASPPTADDARQALHKLLTHPRWGNQEAGFTKCEEALTRVGAKNISGILPENRQKLIDVCNHAIATGNV